MLPDEMFLAIMFTAVDAKDTGVVEEADIVVTTSGPTE